jgi:hypothetical protein
MPDTNMVSRHACQGHQVVGKMGGLVGCNWVDGVAVVGGWTESSMQVLGIWSIVSNVDPETSYIYGMKSMQGHTHSSSSQSYSELQHAPIDCFGWSVMRWSELTDGVHCFALRCKSFTQHTSRLPSIVLTHSSISTMNFLGG